MGPSGSFRKLAHDARRDVARSLGSPIPSRLAALVVLAGCGSNHDLCTPAEGGGPVGTGVELAALQASGRWVDVGLVLDAGGPGAWDAFMEGYTPASIILREGVYHLYYVGADDYIADLRNIGPSHRSLGVAVSEDGIRWSKPLDRPVITFSSSGNPEEGAVSAGMVVDTDGTVLAYYGANVSDDPVTADVHADVRLSTSPDGMTFSPRGRVIDRLRAVPDSMGDEIHATAAFKDGDDYFVYFVPNGGPYSGTLRYCRGRQPEALTDCGEAHRTGGATSVVPLGDDAFAVFLVRRGVARAFHVTGRCLTGLGASTATFSVRGQAKFFLDRARRTWFMYYDQWTHVGLMVAPAGPPDSTPPGPPRNVRADPVDHARARVRWDPATDRDTGILRYNVYRDEALVGHTLDEALEVAGLEEGADHVLEVRAVNLHGLEGPGGRTALRAPDDERPPVVTAVTAVATDTVEVRFDEPVSIVPRPERAAFSLNRGADVLDATIGDDARLVRLATTPLQPESEHSLTYDVIDASSRGNPGRGRVSFTPSVAAGLIGYWPFDGTGPPGVDRSGAGHSGTVLWEAGDLPGPASHGLRFDGRLHLELEPTPLLDEAFDSEFTVATWVRPEQLPPATDNTNAAYSIFSAPAPWKLLYRYDGTFVATTGSIEEPAVLSDAFPPGRWHHVALTGDRATRSLSLFVDGRRVDHAVVSDAAWPRRAPLESPSREAYLSRYRVGASSPLFRFESFFLDGELGELRVYRHALSRVELGQLMAVRPPPA